MSDSEVKRVEIFVLHHSIKKDTKICLESIIEHTDWPYKLTVISTSDYPRGVLAKIYNKLLSESTCDYVAFVCSDSKFTGPWLKKLISHVSPEDGNKIVCAIPLVGHSVNKELNLKRDSGVHKIRAEAISISVSLFRKKAITMLGGFNEMFYLYGHDVDLLVRLEKLGAEFVMDTSVFVDHKVGGTTKILFTKEEIDEIDEYTKRVYTLKNY